MAFIFKICHYFLLLLLFLSLIKSLLDILNTLEKFYLAPDRTRKFHLHSGLNLLPFYLLRVSVPYENLYSSSPGKFCKDTHWHNAQNFLLNWNNLKNTGIFKQHESQSCSDSAETGLGNNSGKGTESRATFSWRGRKRDVKSLSQQLSLMQSLQSLSSLRLNAIFIDYFKSIQWKNPIF